MALSTLEDRLVQANPAFGWNAWGTDAFARAQASRRPILLAITVPWSAACRALVERVETDAELAQWIDARFVPILVDAERRPDIGERYASEGWPTLVALNPVGTPLMSLPTQQGEFKPAAARLLEVFAHRFPELAVAQLASSETASAPSAKSVSTLGAGPAPDPLTVAVELALASADRNWGGFGGDVKFPADVPLRACIAQLARHPDDLGLLAFVPLTLDAMAGSALWDRAEGGVFRAATARDWSRADAVKLLESNVSLIEVYLESAHTLGRSRDRTTAIEIATFVRTHLMHPDGGFFTARWTTAQGTHVDRTMRADVNARAVRAFYHVASTLGDASWEDDAIRAMERLVPKLYERGAGVAHVLGERAEVRGLVADQVAVAAAAIDTFFVTDGSAYCDIAEELMRGVWRKYWRPGWGLTDRIVSTAGAGSMGLLATPAPAFRPGCEAAEVLERLARLTGAGEYAEWAAELWAWLSARCALEGLDAGALALAQRSVEGASPDGVSGPRRDVIA